MPNLYASIEQTLGLPAGILDAIVQQESGGDSWAIRYEPAFFDRYISGKSRTALGGLWPKQVSEETERRARAMSWGPMQIMGQTAREIGYEQPFLSGLCDPTIGIKYGANLLKRKLNAYGEVALAISAYNAGSPTAANVDTYVRPVMARMRTH